VHVVVVVALKRRPASTFQRGVFSFGLGCLGYMCCTCIRIGWPMDWDGTVMVWYGMAWDGIWDDDGGGSLGCGISRV